MEITLFFRYCFCRAGAAGRLLSLLLALAGGRLAAAQGPPLPTRPPTAYLRQLGAAQGLPTPFVYCLLQDRQGYLWLGTAEGLVRYDGRQFQTFTTRDGLAEDFVTGLWQDSARGALWVLHAQGSRSVRAAEAGPFAPAPASHPGGPAPQTGVAAPDTARLGAYARRYALRLPPDVVPTCVLEDREGNAWLGTAGQGLWQHADRHLRAGTGPPAPPDAWPGTLARPARLGGGYWQAAGTAGVRLLDRAGRPTGAWVAGLPRPLGSAATTLAYAPGSGLWVGTVADGLYCRPDDGRPTRHYTTANGLLHNAVVALLADRAGRVWVGAYDTGSLAVWEPAAGTFRRERLGRGGLDVNTLAQDASGALWAGTEGQGLLRRAPDGPWRALGPATSVAAPAAYVLGLRPLPAGLPGGLSGALLLTGPNRLLLAAGAGSLTPLSAANNPLVADLLPGGAGVLTGPPGATVPAWAWLPRRAAGWLCLDLGELARRRGPGGSLPAPGLALAGASVDGANQSAATLGELPAGSHHVAFSFDGLTLTPDGPAGLEYRYRLRGLSDAWSRPSPAGEAQFTALGPGTYELEAQVRRAGAAGAVPAGGWSASVRARFAVATPWWQRPAVLALGGLLLLAAGLGALRLRERELRRQQARLERTVRQRTDELRRQNQAIERMNGELRVARDAAEASRRAKAQFLANMSHEIRTPMNAIVGLTNLLRQTPVNGEQREYLTAIGGSSQNLLVILNDILDSSKMDAGKLTLERVPFRLPELLAGLRPLFQHAALSRDLSWRVELPDDVPPAVLGDPVRLQQVLVNLVSNALKFTHRGGVTLRAAPEPGAPAGHARLRFAVTDTGIGIAPEQQAAIFEDFAQANTSTTREYGGTGLGLSIARHLVRLHGGELGLDSAPGRGSTFYFTLDYPLADPALAPALLGATDGPLPAFEPPLRVLVAEDNPLNQLVARKTLEKWGVEVTLADNGRRAVALAQAAAVPFDAVLMDIQMPELDGYDATRALRRLFPDPARLPIIGLSASVLPEERSQALAVGMNELLPKPFEPALLHGCLAQTTGRHPSAPPAAEAAEAPAVAPHAAPAPVPDWGPLQELAGLSPGLIPQLVGLFLTEGPRLSAQLRAACPHEPATVAALAHKLKGQVAYFGVPALSAQLAELETLARAARPAADYGPLVAAITRQLEQLYPALRQYEAA